MDLKPRQNSAARVLWCSRKVLPGSSAAIGQFMLDLHTNEHGYAEINPPLRCAIR